MVAAPGLVTRWLVVLGPVAGMVEQWYGRDTPIHAATSSVQVLVTTARVTS